MKKKIAFIIPFIFVALASSVLTIFVLQQKGLVRYGELQELGWQFLSFPDMGSSQFGDDRVLSAEDPYFVASQETAPTEVRVEITKEGITPKEFHVKQGKKVTLAAHGGNACQFFHTGEREGLISAMILMPSSEPDVFTTSFAAPPAGTYIFSCKVPGLVQEDMKGVMIVEEE